MERGDESVLVELEADDADRAVTANPPGPAGARPLLPPRRRPGLWVVLVLVLVLAVVTAVRERAERRELERYADIAGVVAPLRYPVEELWRLRASDRVWGPPGLIVTAGAAGVVGREAGTGVVRWSLAVPEPVSPAAVRCPFHGRDETGVVVLCTLPAVAAGTTRIAPPRWVAVGAADGTVVGEVPGEGFLIGAVPVEDDLVTVESAGPDGSLVVTRHDVAGGGQQWSARLAELPPGDAVALVRATGDVITLEGATTVVVRAGDGQELGRWSAAEGAAGAEAARVVGHVGTGFGVWTSRFAGRWYGADGEPGAELAGSPVTAPVQDDSAPGVVLLQSADAERLVAADVGTGEVLWERPSPGRVLLRLGGRLVVTDGTRMRAWDVATGAEQWVTDLGAGAQPTVGAPMTDGRRLVVRDRDPEGALALTAYALSSGERVWQAPLPERTQYVSVLGDHLVAVVRALGGGEEIAVLG